MKIDWNTDLEILKELGANLSAHGFSFGGRLAIFTYLIETRTDVDGFWDYTEHDSIDRYHAYLGEDDMTDEGLEGVVDIIPIHNSDKIIARVL